MNPPSESCWGDGEEERERGREREGEGERERAIERAGGREGEGVRERERKRESYEVWTGENEKACAGMYHLHLAVVQPV